MSSFNDQDILAHAHRADMPIKDGRVDLDAMIGILMSRLDAVQRQAFIEKMSQLDSVDATRHAKGHVGSAPTSHRFRIVLN